MDVRSNGTLKWGQALKTRTKIPDARLVRQVGRDLPV
jgi:hypothetical protein